MNAQLERRLSKRLRHRLAEMLYRLARKCHPTVGCAEAEPAFGVFNAHGGALAVFASERDAAAWWHPEATAEGFVWLHVHGHTHADAQSYRRSENTVMAEP